MITDYRRPLPPNNGKGRLGNAPQEVRAYVCDLYRFDLIPGPLWWQYENGVYDPDTGTVITYGWVDVSEEEIEKWQALMD